MITDMYLFIWSVMTVTRCTVAEAQDRWYALPLRQKAFWRDKAIQLNDLIDD